ncbi:transglutaminase domain-containing protein [Taylorella equigenitalis]|uniref:Transglutaminase-like domain-containing protein n=1 Tax=Taylorella equigenitalis (strain MCE9) TaxID=937774 RepID=A0A654KHJ2_TAYEM|nr:transglutaminase domain-containing protein [Taylorella equigenitalis]ADU91938.1 hypothetical protein TEQUI_1013 [Taylorella equigenitalis MCE9]WDU56710.1 transglutaminase domain-containing protein [Taylorella equigenitalis]
MKKFIFLILSCFLISQSSWANDNSNPAEKILMKANDKNNPLNIWNMDLTDYWSKLSDDILKIYKDRNIQLTPHQMAVVFMDFIGGFKIGMVKGGSDPRYSVQERIGACGSFTKVFISLMAANGIPSRAVGLYNFPKDNGHVVAEVYYDNKWHMYDPTYNLYFTNEPSNLVNPPVLSFEEIKNNTPSDMVLHNITRYYMKGDRFANREIYLNANPAGPLTFENKLFFPFFIDFKKKSVIDNSEFGPKYQNISMLGFGGGNINHKYMISNLNKGETYTLSLIPNFLAGIGKSIRYKVSSPNCRLHTEELTYLKSSPNTNLDIEFLVNGSSCEIVIENIENFENIKYLVLKQVKVFKSSSRP